MEDVLHRVLVEILHEKLCFKLNQWHLSGDYHLRESVDIFNLKMNIVLQSKTKLSCALNELCFGNTCCYV